jgi:hypothetical protein
MKRCTYCGHKTVSEQTASGLCLKCGHINTKADYFLSKWAPVALAFFMFCFVLASGYILVLR